MTRIESLLRKEIGLDAASIGSTQIQRTVRLRMKSAGLKKVEDYERLIGTSPTELNELIEAVVVTETWFFRDREPFTAFAQLALEWLPQHPGGTLRALSVPCSSGEEPYSLAMALLDANVPPHRFAIDAVDISARALARAKEGIYGKNSFRGHGGTGGTPLDFRDHHFQSGQDGYALSARVRACVQFHHDNLLGEKFLTGHAPYDFIFCRNLLIYFDRATQVRALEKIHHLLAPRGVLFVGPAELPLVTESGFAHANLAMAFACRKADNQNNLKSKTQSLKLAPPDFRLQTLDSRPAPSAAHVSASAPSDLEVARQLADAGQLAAAAAICENHLRKEGPSAQAYYLLGLISEAQADEKQKEENRKQKTDRDEPEPFPLSDFPISAFTDAVEFYRKALYLEPNHYETLLHLSLLLEKNGDAAGAVVFKRRAEREKTKIQSA